MLAHTRRHPGVSAQGPERLLPGACDRGRLPGIGCGTDAAEVQCGFMSHPRVNICPLVPRRRSAVFACLSMYAVNFNSPSLYRLSGGKRRPVTTSCRVVSTLALWSVPRRRAVHRRLAHVYSSLPAAFSAPDAISLSTNSPANSRNPPTIWRFDNSGYVIAATDG